MLHGTVKFCGGCNPRFDRGAAYASVRTALSSIAAFDYPIENTRYDVLLIIRGCTGCSYLYEDIDAAHRVILDDAAKLDEVVREIQNILPSPAEEE